MQGRKNLNPEINPCLIQLTILGVERDMWGYYLSAALVVHCISYKTNYWIRCEAIRRKELFNGCN